MPFGKSASPYFSLEKGIEDLCGNKRSAAFFMCGSIWNNTLFYERKNTMGEVNTDYSSLKRRYSGLDLLRVISALMICMFHTTIHLGCNYGILQSVSRMGAVFMTAFFMLSGFSLFVNWGGTSLTNNQIIVKFWKKRFFGIMPIYWFVTLLYVLVTLVFKRETIIRTLVISPIEIIGLQSVFHTLFGVSHNGGTWFISCMLICYALYPFLQELIKPLSIHTRELVLITCVAILLYSPFVTYLFKTEDIYSNPFFRLLEFTIGILLATVKVDVDRKHIVFLYKWWFIVLTIILMATGITIAVKMGIAVGNFMLYSWICLPCFAFILLGLSGVDSTYLNKSKALKWLSGFAYAFFLAPLFSNNACKLLIKIYSIESNIIKILIGWSSCFIIAVGIHFIETRLNRFAKRYV